MILIVKIPIQYPRSIFFFFFASHFCWMKPLAVSLSVFFYLSSGKQKKIRAAAIRALTGFLSPPNPASGRLPRPVLDLKIVKQVRSKLSSFLKISRIVF